MPTYIALLRAVNVGGTGKLPMADLRALCEASGFTGVRTYIASGNVVFGSASTACEAKTTLEQALAARVGKPVAVMIRSPEQLAGVLAANPFPDAAPNHTAAIFLDGPPRGDALESLSGRTTEQVALGEREIYVHYPQGMARSRLRIPAAEQGTARNFNTVAALVRMAGP